MNFLIVPKKRNSGAGGLVQVMAVAYETPIVYAKKFKNMVFSTLHYIIFCDTLGIMCYWEGRSGIVRL
jgi:hypothetical protein